MILLAEVTLNFRKGGEAPGFALCNNSFQKLSGTLFVLQSNNNKTKNVTELVESYIENESE